MKHIFYFFALIVIIIFINACYNDKADLLYGTKNTNCADTTSAISYSAKIVPILNTQCYSCHISGQGGIVMGTHATDKVTAVNGKLFGSINHSSSFSPMPKGAAKMNVCDIAAIKKWIDAGSPNN